MSSNISPFALVNLNSNYFYNVFNLILYSFCCWINSYFCLDKSGLYFFTIWANNWSYNPFSVTVKLIKVA